MICDMIFKNQLTLQIVTADAAYFFSAAANIGIRFYDLNRIDVLRYEARIRKQDYASVQKLSATCGATVTLLRNQGIHRKLKWCYSRPIMMLGLLMLLALNLFLPTRVLLFRVEGNKTIPDKLLLEAAEAAGLSFGVKRSQIRSEQIKNDVLGIVPELEWAGVNTYGCLGVLTVQERERDPGREDDHHGVSKLVAVRDGIVRWTLATKGSLVCSPGQAVTAGETLVSGYEQIGQIIRGSNAEGEIYAQTKHDLTVIMPNRFVSKTDRTSVKTKVSLLIGKKRINLYKDSGIQGMTCDKICRIKWVRVPGGFQLPFGIAIEQWVDREEDANAVISAAPSVDILALTEVYLFSQMISGSVLSSYASVDSTDDYIKLNAHYDCLEMIARVQNEEIIGANGENH